MRFKLNGIKYKYTPEYFKREDDLNVNKPSYSIFRYGKILYNGEWKNCRFNLIEKSGKTQIEIATSERFKNGISEIGKVDSRGIIDVIELSRLKTFQMNYLDASIRGSSLLKIEGS